MKDERILIFKVKNPCTDNCEIKDIQSCKTCNVNKRYKKAITYDKAIEKMARAMCGLEVNCSECDFKTDENRCKRFIAIPTDCGYNYYELAEAALKALLEG